MKTRYQMAMVLGLALSLPLVAFLAVAFATSPAIASRYGEAVLSSFLGCLGLMLVGYVLGRNDA